MLTDRSPTEITSNEWRWLRVKDVTGFPRNARDAYFPEHGVMRPAETTWDDHPIAESDAVAAADRFALETTYLSGKWIVERPPEQVDNLWERVVDDTTESILWDAKVTTRAGCAAFDEEEHALLVFTPNYFDRADVNRVRRRLRAVHDVTEPIRYKPDVYTLDRIHDVIDESELMTDARFRE